MLRQLLKSKRSPREYRAPVLESWPWILYFTEAALWMFVPLFRPVLYQTASKIASPDVARTRIQDWFKEGRGQWGEGECRRLYDLQVPFCWERLIFFVASKFVKKVKLPSWISNACLAKEPKQIQKKLEATKVWMPWGLTSKFAWCCRILVHLFLFFLKSRKMANCTSTWGHQTFVGTDLENTQPQKRHD